MCLRVPISPHQLPHVRVITHALGTPTVPAGRAKPSVARRWPPCRAVASPLSALHCTECAAAELQAGRQLGRCRTRHEHRNDGGGGGRQTDRVRQAERPTCVGAELARRCTADGLTHPTCICSPTCRRTCGPSAPTLRSRPSKTCASKAKTPHALPRYPGSRLNLSKFWKDNSISGFALIFEWRLGDKQRNQSAHTRAS